MTLGWTFTVDFMIDVSQLGVYDDYNDGLSSSQKISIWRISDQTRLAATTIARGTIGAAGSNIAFQAIPPITLYPNTPYIVTFLNAQNYYPGLGFLTSANRLTIAAGINIENSSRRIMGDAFPTQTSTSIPIPLGPTFSFSLTTFQISFTAQNGTITSDSTEYLPGTTAILTATPNPGYLFSSWAGGATGAVNPLSLVMDSDKTITATFSPDTGDADDDGLTNHQEIVEYGTDPTKKDTDGDGAKDGVDGKPLDPTETLDTDRDGIGDNADLDDDADGLSDVEELTTHGTNPKRADSDGDGLSDPSELQTHLTNPNVADTDDDGLSDGAEFLTYHTNPKVGDTDGDGFLDGYEVLTGKSPLNILDKPALVAEARTAIEFTFPAALGKTYRIEDSFDLTIWTTVESGIAGAGTMVQRFYTTRNVPKRYFRVEEDAP